MFLFSSEMFILYRCEAWSLSLGEECRFSENNVLRRIFGPKREEVKEDGENYKMRSFLNLYC